MEKTLYLVRGVSGTGKSTYAKTLSPHTVEADDFFMEDGVYNFDASKVGQSHDYCRKEVMKLMKLQEPIITVTNTFTRLWEMEYYFNISKKYGYTVKVIRMESYYGNTHNVPLWKIYDMHDRFEDYDGEEVIGSNEILDKITYEQAFWNFIYNSPDINIKDTTYHPNYKVIKYKPKVFYRNSWNQFLENCRGTIVDMTNRRIVQLPFRKIYNYGIEVHCPEFKDNEHVIMLKKYNGFMAALTYDEPTEQFIVSTTGAANTDSVNDANPLVPNFVNLAQEMLQPTIDNLDAETFERLKRETFIYEICNSELDPHIIPEHDGVYLIGRRAKRINSKVVPCGAFQCMMFKDAVRTSREADHEGYVIYSLDGSGRATKVKSSYYLISKYFARTDDILKLDKNKFDEEYYPLYDHIKDVRDKFEKLSEQERLIYIRRWIVKNYG